MDDTSFNLVIGYWTVIIGCWAGTRWRAFTDYWLLNRYSVDMKVDGFDLIISNAQREDDSEIQCSLQNSDLNKRVKLSVLGEFSISSLFVCLSLLDRLSERVNSWTMCSCSDFNKRVTLSVLTESVLILSLSLSFFLSSFFLSFCFVDSSLASLSVSISLCHYYLLHLFRLSFCFSLSL